MRSNGRPGPSAKILIPFAVGYALLSLAMPRSTAVSLLETTGLLFSRPFERLFQSCLDGLEFDAAEEDGKVLSHVDPALVIKGPMTLADQDRLWWRKTLAPPDGVTTFGVRLRALGPVPPDRDWVAYRAETGTTIRPGDPVVIAKALVGFVSEVQGADGRTVIVRLLSHAKSSIVVGVVEGTVAGSSITFAAGGSGKLPGSIRVGYSSTRYGLRPGCAVYTAREPQARRVPPGYFLGVIDTLEAERGRVHGDILILPPFAGDELSRAAALVSGGRPMEARSASPTVSEVAVTVRPRKTGTGGQASGYHVTGGIEKGFASGDLLTVDGVAVGLLRGVGILLSTADPLLARGARHAAVIRSRKGGPIPFHLDVIGRDDQGIRIRSDRRLVGIEPGLALFLAVDPLSGLEAYPAAHVLTVESEDTLLLVTERLEGVAPGRVIVESHRP